MHLFLLTLLACGSLTTTVPTETCTADCDSESGTEGSVAEPEICGDGIDNDHDYLIDCLDTDCDGQCPEACTDGRDNDGDGLVDCADSDCFAETCPEVCDDEVDNDLDGTIDCLDLDCSDPACPEDCDDNWDNDGDGNTDCTDPDCDGQCPEYLGCADGRDNDGDGLTDCEDSDCFDAACPELCDDGLDNNGDGVFDCDDPTCLAECDGDGDGYYRADYGYDDCDDADATIHPGAVEICEDFIDQDCSGADLACGPACQNLGWKLGSDSWTCPAGLRMPTVAEYNLVLPCMTAADLAFVDYYHDIAVSVGGCGCKWNASWCTPQSIETINGGRMCGDFTQLHICVQ